MSHLRLGIRLDCLNLPLRKGLLEAARLGVAGVQLNASGDLAPDALTQTGQRELRHLLRSCNLELTALACPLRHGLDTPAGQEARIDYLRKAMQLSFDLGPRRVIVQAGRIPDDLDSAPGRLLTEAMQVLGGHGDRVGTILALETGLEPGATLAAFLDRFDTGGLGVNLDPANFLLNQLDPVANTRALQGRVVHAHAKDARGAAANRAAQEVPLGHGDLEWMSYLAVLEEIEYRGWLVVERESGTNRLGDIAQGIAFLRRLVGT